MGILDVIVSFFFKHNRPQSRWRDVKTGRFVKTPVFRRFTYAINGYTWQGGTKIQFSVSGRYFCIDHTDALSKREVRNEVNQYVYEKYLSKGGNARATSGEEDERVSEDETVGLELYTGEILDKGKRIYTFDIRFRREGI